MQKIVTVDEQKHLTSNILYFAVEETGYLVSDAEDRGQQRGADPHAVTRLAEIHCPGIVVDLRWDLAKVLVPGKWMQDRCVRFHSRHQVASQPVA